MNEGGWAEAATAVRRYHALSKHHPRHYAPGPGGLRRPLWLPRAFQPDVSTYRLEP